ncbi:MAG: plastocyanin/azurin family copper-binding protein [Candidatus Methylomirabilales bacterium]
MTFQRISKTGVGMLAAVASLFLASVTANAFNTVVNSIKLEDGERMVIVDNTGAGTTFNAEITWRFDPSECKLQTTTDGTTFDDVTNDSAFGGNPAHADVSDILAVVLVAQPGEECKIDPNHGEFVTVSSVGAAGAGGGGDMGGGDMVVVGATVDLVSPGGGGALSFQDTTSTTSASVINAGEKVVWTYQDPSGQPHTVTSGACPPCTPDGNFDSGIGTPLQTIGETFEHIFTTAGTFPYFCQIHTTNMTGQVTVN